ncbi:undecaprenyldiphospho-muramoylpentapeptide beta-N-acetylglucosaminyltransferase [Pseudohalioglobus lutimaris]|uniref:UDP-N-acetylglucosamine--N-acetylmuramyl-(pentapeptide) pyrophosphoryl-undecaprenol N-acetylglucosamine transferase n=1 Tax=Pseudohalioglobus lutimaris TaxID=1737061 RepID=A0A2N5X7A9_9GAMM|nr:undecaprenyldiphospho-muramoylpentapeptide beta-N-acetylglucosaminyltransferase [Pseudohalioglobus lutimaris]PLW70376.1 undecaprenyldiphospho-muramoylpentapeptide beta-N-acetylglucosaminyltransferase [Pseudohalioglobus lutimaris]
MSGNKRILIMAGGTGGHVYPALAVASELRERGYQVEWVGTRRGLEHRVVPAAGFALHYLAVRGVRGKGVSDRLIGLLLLILASLQALWLVLRTWPACVVGMGGYVAGPAGVAAWLLRRPLLIHEQNAVAGTTNRMLAPLADKIVAGFDGAFSDDREVAVLGNPVRADLITAAGAAEYDYDGQRAMRLLVLGGSLGARPINEIMPGVVRSLLSGDTYPTEILHQAGEQHAADVAAQYGDLISATVRVVPFIEDMADAYIWSDLVICRAGALTVSELAVTGRPAILVPLPHAIDDHQTANARSLSSVCGATLLRQSDMTEDALLTALRTYVEHPERLRTMAEAAHKAAYPLATQQVADEVEALADAA